MSERICKNCGHEEKYHATINFAFHKQYGCRIVNCECKNFSEIADKTGVKK